MLNPRVLSTLPLFLKFRHYIITVQASVNASWLSNAITFLSIEVDDLKSTITKHISYCNVFHGIEAHAVIRLGYVPI